jgi:putative nucleotidyltransferase with HDIG domain
MDFSNINILCVDDDDVVLAAIKNTLGQAGFFVTTASSGFEALNNLSINNFDIILCDMEMPEMSGSELFKIIKNKYPDIVRILLTGTTDVNSVAEAVNLGSVYYFLTKPCQPKVLIDVLISAIDLINLKQSHALLSRQLEENNIKLNSLVQTLEERVKFRTKDLTDANEKLKKSYITSIKSISGMLGLRHRGLLSHSRDVANLAFKFSKHLGMSDAECQEVFIGGLLHDIGKISFNDKLLLTPFHDVFLSDLPTYQNHTTCGALLIRELEDMKEVAAIVAGHHEQVNGKGYPLGKTEEDLSTGTQIVSIVESYFDLIDGEKQRRTFTSKEALNFIINEQGTLFSRNLVPYFIQLFH